MASPHAIFAAHDVALIQRESAIRGLGCLLDPQAFRDYLARQFPDWNAPAWLPVYLRYKPLTNCIVTYAAENKGRTEYLYAKAFGPQSQAKLHKRDPRADVARGWPSIRRWGSPSIDFPAIRN